MPSGHEVRRVAGAARQGDLIGIFASSSERETLDQVQAVMAVIEGHAEHVMDSVAPDLLPSLPQLRSALDRRRRSQSGLSRLLAKLLGLELKLRQYEQGKYFCDSIVERAGTPALTHLFSSAEALPTMPELLDPPALATPGRADRTVGSGLQRVEVPRVRNPAQGVVAPVVETQPGAHHQVLDGARGQHLAGRRLVHDPRGDVDGQAAHVIVA